MRTLWVPFCSILLLVMYMEHMNITQFNNWAKNNIVDENMFDDDGFIIMDNDTNYKSTGIIASIFNNHWKYTYF